MNLIEKLRPCLGIRPWTKAADLCRCPLRRLFSLAGPALMKRSSFSWLVCLALFITGLFAIQASSQNPSSAALRTRAQKLMSDGNFRDAYDAFRRLCLDPNAGASQVSQD